MKIKNRTTPSHLFCRCFLRQVYIIRYGLKERRQLCQLHGTPNIAGPFCVNPKLHRMMATDVDYYMLRKYYGRDSSYLGLIDSFLQDGPQLILQIYILTKRHPEELENGFTGSAVISFMSSFLLTSLFLSRQPFSNLCP